MHLKKSKTVTGLRTCSPSKAGLRRQPRPATGEGSSFHYSLFTQSESPSPSSRHPPSCMCLTFITQCLQIPKSSVLPPTSLTPSHCSPQLTLLKLLIEAVPSGWVSLIPRGTLSAETAKHTGLPCSGLCLS